MGGTKQKVGKARRDKYYHLAKESGFRARSAFKLIQLNRKFEFLQKARVCIDLCAAPGGWMQVAAKFMPVSSLIIGVDLVPILPIRGCISFAADITTDTCRQRLRKEMKHFKADVVLHDGAPNVGAAWLQDSYSQAHLVLMSLKLATEFLRPGGTFVTKVFRSRDYQSLVWVFKQLFSKVQATKPTVLASRVSAEIFVVCQNFLAPAKIDPRMFDAGFVFSEIEEPSYKLDIANPKKKRKAEGYADGDKTFTKSVNAEIFVESTEYLELLASCAKIEFSPGSDIETHPRTTADIKYLCSDLKVLGKTDFRQLMKWRKEMQEFLAAKNKAEEGSDVEEMEDEEELDPEAKAQADLALALEEHQMLTYQKMRQEKRSMRRAEMKRRKRLALSAADDIDDITRDHTLFDLKAIKSKGDLETVDEAEWDALGVDQVESEWPAALSVKKKEVDDEQEDGSDADSEDDYMAALEAQLDNQYEDYRMRKGTRSKRVKIAHNKSKRLAVDSDGTMMVENRNKLLQNGQGDDSSDDSDGDQDASENPLVQDSSKTTRRAAMWFSQDQFAGLEDDVPDQPMPVDDVEEDKPASKANGKGASTSVPEELEKMDEDVKGSSDFAVVSADTGVKTSGDNLDAEGLAIAQHLLAKGGKRKLIDASFHRYAHNDDPMPTWFEDEEWVHKQIAVPITKETVNQIKAAQAEIAARPVKKVREAKAKKKMRALRKMEKVKSQALAISENTMMTEQEKARNIAQLYKKAAKAPKQEKTYVIAKRGLAGKRVARPSGVSGNYKVVDARMKKDLRAAKAKAKTKGRRRR